MHNRFRMMTTFNSSFLILLLTSSVSTVHSLAQVAAELRPGPDLAPPSMPQVSAAASPVSNLRGPPAEDDAVTLISKTNLKFILALLAGWADVACVRQYKCFGIMMTGNNIKMAMSFAEKDWKDTVFFGLLIVYYVAGVCIFRCVDLTLQAISQKVVALPIFLLCASADVLSYYFPKDRWHMFLLVTAFGAVNGVSTGKVSAVTCMMTGHLHKLGNDLVDFMIKGSSGAKKLTPMVNIGVLVSFFTGLASGAASVRWNWLPNFPKFTFLGACYCALLLLFDVKVHVPKFHHVNHEPGDRWVSFFERPRELSDGGEKKQQ